MKIRTGFVSNSSTSSFICDVCGKIEAGRDLTLDDCEMRMCANGHYFHDSEIDEKDLEDLISCENEENLHYDINPKYCPICKYTHIADCELEEYLYKVVGMTKEELKAHIKSKFKTYKEFSNYLKGVKHED